MVRAYLTDFVFENMEFNWMNNKHDQSLSGLQTFESIELKDDPKGVLGERVLTLQLS
jgi:hypothetical protein